MLLNPMIWGHLTCKSSRAIFSQKRLKEQDRFSDQDINGRIKIKVILNKQDVWVCTGVSVSGQVPMVCFSENCTKPSDSMEGRKLHGRLNNSYLLKMI
jgi:hypothetical protein